LWVVPGRALVLSFVFVSKLIDQIVEERHCEIRYVVEERTRSRDRIITKRMFGVNITVAINEERQKEEKDVSQKMR
jgi:hypothetical protein